MTHTPGPWRYHAAESTNYETFAITGSNEHGGSVLPILAMTYNWPNNQEANARLISEAPRLKTELEKLVAYMEEYQKITGSTLYDLITAKEILDRISNDT